MMSKEEEAEVAEVDVGNCGSSGNRRDARYDIRTTKCIDLLKTIVNENLIHDDPRVLLQAVRRSLFCDGMDTKCKARGGSRDEGRYETTRRKQSVISKGTGRPQKSRRADTDGDNNDDEEKFDLLSKNNEDGEEQNENEDTYPTTIAGIGNEPIVIMKLFKFLILTSIFYIPLAFWFIRTLEWEADPTYTLSKFISYDLHPVLLDSFVFFFVGRLHKRRGIDRFLPNVIPLLLGCFIPSITSKISWMRHSVSMFDIVCAWPWQLFLFVFGMAMSGIGLVVHHVQAFREEHVLCQRIFEILSVSCICLLPTIFDPNFHFHHWYASWLFGMTCFNASTTISQICQMYFWGCYINGVAVYGRDPILGCQHSFYWSTSNRCSYMSCYVPPNVTIEEGGIIEYDAFIPPNWRNCSGHYV